MFEVVIAENIQKIGERNKLTDSRHLARGATLWNIRKFIQEKNLLNVTNVIKLSPGALT